MNQSVVVVGGGVVGASIAWHLLERGFVNVTLVERERLGCGTTWHSAGNITWKPVPDTDQPIVYMLELLERLERETEQSTGWLRTGRLFVSRSVETMRRFEGYHETALASGMRGVLLEPRDVAAHHPLIDSKALVGAWLNPRSGRLNPADLVAAFARGIRQRGGRIVEPCEVQDIDCENGRVRALATSQGPIAADLLVMASGLWSRQMLAKLDIALAHGVCEHFYAIADVTPRLSRETPSFICSERLIYGREEVGGFLVGFFDRNAKVVDVSKLPEPFTFTLLEEDWDQITPYFTQACELFPSLTNAPIRKLVNGPEAFTTDGRPLVGAIDSVDGLYVACALNSSGVTYCGMVGHNVADLLQGLPIRFGDFDCDPMRFPEDERMPEWIDGRMRDAPSGAYARHHR